MPLPSRTMPSTLPDWRIEGYQAEPEPIFGHVRMSTGAGRSRQIWTAADRVESASIKLWPASLPIWFTFVEDTLQAGLLPFAARLANLGPGVRWYETQLLEWRSTPKPNGATIITARLLLRGDAYLSGPSA